MDKAKAKIVKRMNRANRVREKVYGTSERPRLSVRRSLKHIYAQLVDDTSGSALVQIGTTGKEMAQKKAAAKGNAKMDEAKLVGEILAARAIEKGITKVVFDRKGYPFHGRVKALADAARAKGLQF
jgi:large subunit ribosomal protein L18